MSPQIEKKVIPVEWCKPLHTDPTHFTMRMMRDTEQVLWGLRLAYMKIALYARSPHAVLEGNLVHSQKLMEAMVETSNERKQYTRAHLLGFREMMEQALSAAKYAVKTSQPLILMTPHGKPAVDYDKLAERWPELSRGERVRKAIEEDIEQIKVYDAWASGRALVRDNV